MPSEPPTTTPARPPASWCPSSDERARSATPRAVREQRTDDRRDRVGAGPGNGELGRHVRVQRNPGPMVTLAKDTHLLSRKIDIVPHTPENLRALTSRAFHHQNRRELVNQRGRAKLGQLFE